MEPAPFAIKMENQRRVHLLGLVRNLEIKIAKFLYTIAAVVLRMEDIKSAYPLLLGRPWLKQAKAKQDWAHNTIQITKGKKKLKM